ncbi:hypothetical protein Q1695_015670 [Nippostrongylus brasiliensis]|nr:hypothetical protein Q1695_015670 [Nippostrongylus brasiliensis]
MSRRRRRFYMRPAHELNMGIRFRTFDMYLCTLDEKQFHEYTRMYPEEFMNVYSRVAHRLHHKRNHRAPIAATHRLAIALRYLGHGMSFVSVAHEMQLGASTVKDIVYEVCNALIEAVASVSASPGPNNVGVDNRMKSFGEV